MLIKKKVNGLQKSNKNIKRILLYIENFEIQEQKNIQFDKN